ncbi:hypothetical protein BDZ45DRAFT_799947 [Acephala macrosclerotiorum]|nr:hypothetical protein BDZ45DRAFT_799947 [Acephala macrosclerotiorum]
MMFFPEFPVRAVAYQQAKIYIYENPEAFRQVHDHNTPEGRDEYAAEVARCKARFPDGFPGSTPGLGKDYFVTQLFLHVNGRGVDDPTVEGVIGLKEYLEEVIGERIVYAPASAVINANLAMMKSPEAEEEEEEEREHEYAHEKNTTELGDNGDKSVFGEGNSGTGYMFDAEDEEQTWSGNEGNAADDDEYNPFGKSKTPRAAKASSSARSNANSTPRTGRGSAQIGVQLGLINPASQSSSQAAPHHTQTLQPYMVQEAGLVDLCYFPRCNRCSDQRRGFHCDRKFPCSKCAKNGKDCVREPLSKRTASGYYGNRTGIMIDPIDDGSFVLSSHTTYRFWNSEQTSIQNVSYMELLAAQGLISSAPLFEYELHISVAWRFWKGISSKSWKEWKKNCGEFWGFDWRGSGVEILVLELRKSRRRHLSFLVGVRAVNLERSP